MDSINLVPYIEDDRLYDYAAACARTLRPEGMDDGRSEAQTLRRCFQEAERCHTLLQRRYEGASHIPAACEWLLDNFYLLQRDSGSTLPSAVPCGRPSASAAHAEGC